MCVCVNRLNFKSYNSTVSTEDFSKDLLTVVCCHYEKSTFFFAKSSSFLIQCTSIVNHCKIKYSHVTRISEHYSMCTLQNSCCKAINILASKTVFLSFIHFRHQKCDILLCLVCSNEFTTHTKLQSVLLNHLDHV